MPFKLQYYYWAKNCVNATNFLQSDCLTHNLGILIADPPDVCISIPTCTYVPKYFNSSRLDDYTLTILAISIFCRAAHPNERFLKRIPINGTKKTSANAVLMIVNAKIHITNMHMNLAISLRSGTHLFNTLAQSKCKHLK